jgi:hypothetical protein
MAAPGHSEIGASPPIDPTSSHSTDPVGRHATET